MDGGTRVENLAKMSFMACKFAIKEVSGIVNEDDSEFKLEFDEKGVSTESLNTLLTLELSQELLTTCQTFIQGIPKEILNPTTKKKFENVEILPQETVSKKN